MPKSHVKFHSASGKRLILVADDEAINRELLGMILQDEYEVIYAANGQETVDMVRVHRETLSLVLLDLMMPVKSGMEALREIKADKDLKSIPVIVLTADQDAEVESLSVGAIDYIPKPYPPADIIKARILKAIELSEDRDIIQSTERDPLTGLYNREYFYRYAEQYDQHHRDVAMDAIVVDINHFHMINERFGKAYGDEVLQHISERIRETVAAHDGIVCRRQADTFLVYCPHGVNHKEILQNASIDLTDNETINSRVRLRLGVYENCDKALDIERRFDRAKLAADTVKGSFTKTIGKYDDTLHERELYAERLIDDFHKGIEENQFVVYYQPKYDIRPRGPVLYSAEALVRWEHPELGLVSPGIFIPLFEDNGLVQELDHYVWRKTAEQIRDWKERLGFAVPVSVNVSRIDMYDPALFETVDAILRETGVTTAEFFLEITESAYTEDSEQIIEVVNQLRTMGFRIEMDDFGTGYSSLNMISTLPIDVLKLDMQFVRSAFKDQKDTRMFEVIIDIADHLSVPVVAEGVETEEQMLALKDLGCDVVQGYYFSKPVPPADFEPFLLRRRDVSEEDLQPEEPPKAVEEEPAQPTLKEPKKQRALQLRAINYIFAASALVIAIALAVSGFMVNNSNNEINEATHRYNQAEQAADELSEGSDYLTDCVRAFAVTGKIDYLNDYFEEVNVVQRRNQALEDLNALLEGRDNAAYASLSAALEDSNELMYREYTSMRLTQLAEGYPDAGIPQEVLDADVRADLLAASAEQQRAAAQAMVFDSTYMSYKERIRGNVQLCADRLLETSENELTEARETLSHIIVMQNILLLLLALVVLAEVLYITMQVRIPLTRLVEVMRRQEKADPAGASELRFVSETYNEILTENRKAYRQLNYEATHDALTGLLNRSAYEAYMENMDTNHIALLIIDIDKFKDVNDTYGHDVGDRLLRKVAEILKQSFRSVDLVCRLGGDEFVVVMTRANSSMRQLVINKIARANGLLQRPADDLPKASLSVGVAFSDRENPAGDIFKDADTALYAIKQGGRCGCAIYGEHSKASGQDNQE